MNSEDIEKVKEIVLYVITIIEAMVSIYFMVTERFDIAIVFLCILLLLIFFIIYFVFYKKKDKNKIVFINQEPIESLVLADMYRTSTSSLCLNEVVHKAIINHQDLSVIWNYSGVCIDKKGESKFLLSISGDSQCLFADLNCYGYDLIEDVDRLNKINPILISSDGLCKKISLPLLRKLNQHDPFSVEFHYTWLSCIKNKKDYFISSLSFENNKVNKYTVILEFKDINPDWVRVYNSSGELIKSLVLTEENDGNYIYVDDVNEPSAHSTLIYQFYRKIV